MKDSVALLQCPGYESQIEQISSKYQIPVVANQQNSSIRFLLDIEDGILKLIEPGSVKFRPIYSYSGSLKRISRRTLLGRAIGRKVQTVIDATAGLGGDAILLSRMGYSVLAIERQPVIAALLEDGILRILERSDRIKLEFRFADSRRILSNLNESPDVIYLDPMYPVGRKASVAVARPIRILRELAGDDSDAESLLNTSLKFASRRVVIKRPHFAEPLRRDKLSDSVMGKLVRYDFYQVS